jgi:hypothetical protein
MFSRVEIHHPPMKGLFHLATTQIEFVWKVIDFFRGALTTGTARSWGVYRSAVGLPEFCTATVLPATSLALTSIMIEVNYIVMSM